MIMKIINALREGWGEIPNSVKFWNGLVLLILIGVGVYNIEVLGVVLAFGSLLAWAVIVDNNNTEDHLWIWFTPFMWVISLIALIVLFGMFISSKTIAPFNEWLDKKKGDEE